MPSIPIETPVMASRLLDSPIGVMVASASDVGITSLGFLEEGDTHGRADRGVDTGGSSHLQKLEHELTLYFAGKLREFKVALDLSGTAFQLRVWQELLGVAWGRTISYGELARRIDRPDASRAVARANGANPVAIVVPCHRVIGSDGSLTGYGGGLERKRKLLEIEGGLGLLPM